MTPFARASLLVAGGALICAIAGAPSAPADAAGGKLAYGVHGAHGRGWIVVVDVGGVRVRRLVPTARHGWSEFRWSPDGSRLAAVRIGRGGIWDAVAAAIDGGGARFVAKAPRGREISDVSWSPDSRTLAFVRGKTYPCGSGSLWVVRFDGKAVRRLVPRTAPGVVLSIGDWSPDGKQLLYRTTTIGDGTDCRRINVSGSALFTIAAKGSRPQRVVKTQDEIWDEAWSPDGSRIAYVTCYLTFLLPCEPWLVDITGNGRRSISEPVDSINSVGIDWTSDSRELVIPYLCGPQNCEPAGECDPKTFSGGLRAIDLQTGQTRTIVSRSGCVSAAVLAISRTAGTIGFVWASVESSPASRPMLVALDGSRLQRLPPPPKVAGGRVDPFPALYLP